MIDPNFIMVAAIYASTLHTMASSTIIMQDSWNNVYAVNTYDKLLPYLSAPKKTMVVINSNDEHNFDINLGQTGVENQKWSQPSLSEVFDRCEDLSVVRASAGCRCKQTVSQCGIEKIVLSFYGIEDFKSGFADFCVQKNTLNVGVRPSAPVVEESQEVTWFHTRKTEQTIRVDSLPLSSEKDVFACKGNGVSDAFATEDSLLEEQQE